MNENKNSEMLHRLADSFVDDLFVLTDEEIMQEAAEDGVAELFTSKFDEARSHVLTELGLRRLTQARSALESYRKNYLHPIEITPEEARRRIMSIFSNDNTFLITIAARSGRGLSDSDALSLFLDFVELGVIKRDIAK
jgi:hypothetical protein